MSVLWWLFHLRQNCWSSSMVVLASFPRFCTDEKTSVDKQRSVMTDEKPGRRTSTETCRRNPSSPSRAPFLLTVLSIDRTTRRYLVLPRPIIIAHIEPNDVPAKVRLSTFVPIRQSHGSLLPRLFLSFFLLSRTRPSREDDGGESSATKRRSFQNGRVSDASVGSLFWPFPLCVSGNGNGLPWWG